MHHDGMKQGFDIEHLAKIKQLVNIPIIASGVEEMHNIFVELFQHTDVSAGLAASILHDQETTVAEIKDKMREGRYPCEMNKPIDFSKGLVPVILQHAQTDSVLMLGYMNEEAYQKL